MSLIQDNNSKMAAGIVFLKDAGWYVAPSGYRAKLGLYKCFCGKNFIAHHTKVNKGKHKSCGCRIGFRNPEGAFIKDYRNPLFSVWNNMKLRCYNKKHPAYKYYGAKEIRVYKKWIHDFKAFYDWAMETGYKKGLTLDRKKNYRGYFPSNLRWITHKEQMRNITRNKFITYKGQTKCMTEWSLLLGGSKTLVRERIFRNGWDEIKAITTPINHKKTA